jgi:hypothetical protein
MLLAIALSHGAIPDPVPGQLDVVALFGFLAAFVTLIFVKEHRRHGAMLGLSLSLAASAAYGFLSGAWPLGMVAIVVSAMALHRWRTGRRVGEAGVRLRAAEDRRARMFGQHRAGFNAGDN